MEKPGKNIKVLNLYQQEKEKTNRYSNQITSHKAFDKKNVLVKQMRKTQALIYLGCLACLFRFINIRNK